MRINPWLPYNKSAKQPEHRLFFFHHAGGAASMYLSWQEMFPPSIEICPVQLPGRENRYTDCFITSMPDLIDEICYSLKPYMDLPFSFFGHSLGGLIAFELTRRLHQVNIKPCFLCISACSAPRNLRREPKLHLFPDKELINELKSYGATPEAILENLEMLQILLPRIRADFELFETYQYQPQIKKLENMIVAFGGIKDPFATQEKMQDWKEETNFDFQSHLFHGNHFYLFQPIFKQIVCAKLVRLLSATPAGKRRVDENP